MCTIQHPTQVLDLQHGRLGVTCVAVSGLTLLCLTYIPTCAVAKWCDIIRAKCTQLATQEIIRTSEGVVKVSTDWPATIAT